MKKSTRFVSFILAAMMTMSTFTALSVTTSADNTTSSVTSAKETSHPEPIHIYEVQKVNGSWKVGPDFRTAFSKDFAYTATKTSLKSVMNKAFKEWVKDNGLKYTYAYVKVFYYDGTTTTYKKKASSFSSQTTKPGTTNETAQTVDTRYKNTYLYKKLSAAQQKWIDWWVTGAKKDEPNLSEADKDIARNVMWRCRLSAIDNSISEYHQKAYEVANRIIAKALKQKTDYDKIKTIHDGLCKYAKYGYDYADGTGGNITRVNLLALGVGVCEAYADTFAYLCQFAGLDCFRVSGKANNGSWGAHGWNMIKLDGKWYYVDVTWDDGSDIRYKYFLKGSVTMSKDHKIKDELIRNLYPTASKTDYKYPETPKLTIEKVSVCPDEIHIYETDNGEVSPKFKSQYKKDGSSAQTCGVGATDVAICMMMSNKESVYKSEFEYFNVKIYYYSGELKSFKAKTSDYRGKYRDLIGW